MKRFINLLFILVLLLPKGFAQEEKTYNCNAVSLYIMPVSLLDYTPRFRFGVEYESKSALAYSIDVGFGNYATISKEIHPSSIWGKDYTSFEIRPEVKYYFHKPNPYVSLYTSAEIFYISVNNTFDTSYYYPAQERFRVYFDQAKYRKQKIGGVLKFGVKLTPFERISFDFYTGLGLAYRNKDYSQLINPETSVLSEDREWFSWSKNYLYAGESVIVQLSFGAKIGVILWKD